MSVSLGEEGEDGREQANVDTLVRLLVQQAASMPVSGSACTHAAYTHCARVLTFVICSISVRGRS